MIKSNWRFRLWTWWAVKVLRVPYTVNFTPPDSDKVVGIGFAWSVEIAQRMRGDNRQVRRASEKKRRSQAKRGIQHP